MFLKLKTAILVSAIFMIIGLMLFVLLRQPTSANDIPDTPEARAVMATLDRAYELLNVPAELLDFEEFDAVFIDHPDYLKELSATQRKKMETQLTKYLGAKAAQTLGYRSLMKSKLTGERVRLTQYRAALAKAKQQNQMLTTEELEELAEENNGYVPALPDLSVMSTYKQELNYFSLTIHGDKARATYDEGVTGRTAILVRIDGKWYVAGIF